MCRNSGKGIFDRFSWHRLAVPAYVFIACGIRDSPASRLSFESARSLFADLTPARLDLLDTLRRVGPCSVYALAKAAERNYSNVHTDVARMEALGLVERTESDEVAVPYESIEILLPLARETA